MTSPDAATLDLLQDLLTQPDMHHLLLIGAYRDNEVTSAHPLMTGALTDAENRLSALSTHAVNTVEKATVTCLRVDRYVTLDWSDRAIAVGLDQLR